MPEVNKGHKEKVRKVEYHIAGNFHQEKISPILPPALTGENFLNFFSCVKDCIADMATFTILAKFYPSKIIAIQR